MMRLLLLIHTTTLLLFSHFSRADMEPFIRSDRPIVASLVSSSTSSDQNLTLIGGVGCARHCQDTYLMRVSDQGETTSLGQRNLPSLVRSSAAEKFIHFIVSSRKVRGVCPDDYMLDSYVTISRREYRVTCGRLSAHLRKNQNRRASQKIHGLARINVEGTNNNSRASLPNIAGRDEQVIGPPMDEVSMCEQSFYVDGLECANDDCSQITLLCVQVLVDKQLAEELFCTLLQNRDGSLLLGLPISLDDSTALTLRAAGSPFAGLRSWRRSFGSELLVGVHVLGDPEWVGALFRRGEGSTCPDGMFMSELQVFDDSDLPNDSIRIHRRFLAGSSNPGRVVRIKCSRLERNLRIGDRTYRCAENTVEGSFANFAYCEDNGFITGMSYANDSCDGELQIECRSLRCL